MEKLLFSYSNIRSLYNRSGLSKDEYALDELVAAFAIVEESPEESPEETAPLN